MTTTEILTNATPFLLPHTWGAAYSPAVCDDGALLRAWIQASRCFSVSLDSRGYSRLDAACIVAKSLGWDKLRVSFCWSPFPEPLADGTPNKHGAGSFTNEDVLLPADHPKWVQWRTYWSGRLTGWTQAWQRACKVFGESFIEPCAVIDAEAFAHLAAQKKPLAGTSAVVFDSSLWSLYEQVEGFASVFGSGGLYWYGADDAQEIITTVGDPTTIRWRPPGYFHPTWEMGVASCPVGYFGHDVRRTQRRIEHAIYPGRKVAPFWSPCFEVAPGFIYERDIERSETKPDPMPAGKTWVQPWYRSHSVQLGAFFAELADRQKLSTVITWPGPGTTTCDPAIFAQRFTDVAAGASLAQEVKGKSC